MTTAVRTLLTEVLEAHGGIDRWRRFTEVTAKVVTGGFLWGMKGIDIDSAPRSMTSDFKRQRTRTDPFGDPDWHMTYQPDCVVIATHAGETIAQQQHPRETFAGHVWETPWSPLQLGYFNGYAMWTYYNLPFLLGEPGVETTEIASIDPCSASDLRLRRRARVAVPDSTQSLRPKRGRNIPVGQGARGRRSL
jgi:hypothetical protein